MDIKIIERIKKCLALSRSANPHESARALHHAQVLMQKYGLNEDGIKIAEIQEGRVSAASKSLPEWHQCLIQTVASAFGCNVHITSFFWGNSEVVFLGTAERVEIAGYTYVVLRRNLQSARQKFISSLPSNCKRYTKTLRADRYCQGYVAALHEKIKPLELSDEEKNALNKYEEQNYHNFDVAEPARSAGKKHFNAEDVISGYKDGKTVELHLGVRGSTHRCQLPHY